MERRRLLLGGVVLASAVFAIGGEATSGIQLHLVDALEALAGGRADLAGSFLGEQRFASFQTRFKREAGRWIDEAAARDRPSRLAVASAFALEAVADSFNRDRDEYYAATEMIEWACGRLRRQPPSEFERLFHLASIAYMQGARDEDLLAGVRVHRGDTPIPGGGSHVRHAWERFTDEPRFKLAWLTTRPETRMIAAWPLPPARLARDRYGRFAVELGGDRDQISDTLSRFALLINEKEVGAEARLRRGVLRVLIGQPTEALPDFDTASRSPDGFVRYLSFMMLGTISESRDLVSAASAYRAAWEAIPATRAAVAWASALYRSGQTREAAGLLDQWTLAPRPADPWLLYGQRDYRMAESLRASVRKGARR